MEESLLPKQPKSPILPIDPQKSEVNSSKSSQHNMHGHQESSAPLFRRRIIDIPTSPPRRIETSTSPNGEMNSRVESAWDIPDSTEDFNVSPEYTHAPANKHSTYQSTKSTAKGENGSYYTHDKDTLLPENTKPVGFLGKLMTTIFDTLVLIFTFIFLLVFRVIAAVVILYFLIIIGLPIWIALMLQVCAMYALLQIFEEVSFKKIDFLEYCNVLLSYRSSFYPRNLRRVFLLLQDTIAMT